MKITAKRKRANSPEIRQIHQRTAASVTPTQWSPRNRSIWPPQKWGVIDYRPNARYPLVFYCRGDQMSEKLLEGFQRIFVIGRVFSEATTTPDGGWNFNIVPQKQGIRFAALPKDQGDLIVRLWDQIVMKKANLWGEKYDTLRQLPNKPFGRDAALEIVFAERTFRHYFFNIYKLLFPSKGTPRITKNEGCAPSTALNFAEERWKDIVDYTDKHRDLQALINNDSMDLPWYTLDTWVGFDDDGEDGINSDEGEEEEVAEAEVEAEAEEETAEAAEAEAEAEVEVEVEAEVEAKAEESLIRKGSCVARQERTPPSVIGEAEVLLDTWHAVRLWDPHGPVNEVTSFRDTVLECISEDSKKAIGAIITSYEHRLRTQSLNHDLTRRKVLARLALRMKTIDPHRYAYSMEEDVSTWFHILKAD
ncbi:hypothetical protein FRB94_000425 [Tulasnella sp. JGI-2019a]|nr:hypothetical protein FRB94_000425 [Tulasnella sp. JGI-2019a]